MGILHASTDGVVADTTYTYSVDSIATVVRVQSFAVDDKYPTASIQLSDYVYVVPLFTTHAGRLGAMTLVSTVRSTAHNNDVVHVRFPHSTCRLQSTVHAHVVTSVLNAQVNGHMDVGVQDFETNRLCILFATRVWINDKPQAYVIYVYVNDADLARSMLDNARKHVSRKYIDGHHDNVYVITRPFNRDASAFALGDTELQIDIGHGKRVIVKLVRMQADKFVYKHLNMVRLVDVT